MKDVRSLGRLKVLVFVLAVGAVLQACTARQIGQTIYNSFKLYCHDNPSKCTALDDDY